MIGGALTSFLGPLAKSGAKPLRHPGTTGGIE
jgi:hypothetical protein